MRLQIKNQKNDGCKFFVVLSLWPQEMGTVNFNASLLIHSLPHWQKQNHQALLLRNP